MNVALFVLQFPEFAQVDANRIQAALNRAATRMGGPDASVWGSLAPAGQPPTQADEAQGCYAGALLMGSPYGFETRLQPGNGSNQYENRYLDLRDANCSGFIVAGGASSWPWLCGGGGTTW